VAAVISVLIPSRGRCRFLERAVLSLRETARGPIEILVGLDDDDPFTKDVAVRNACVVVETPRLGYGNLYQYFNLMAERSTGDWLVLWDDSSVMTTEGWDQMLYDLPDSILVGDLQNHFSPSLCAFPAVRRNAYEALGYYSPDTPHVDTVWEVIGKNLNAIAPVNAYVHHDRPDITGIPADTTFLEGRQHMRSADFWGSAFQSELWAASERIRHACLPL
jgi:hypothetical protein